MHKENHKKALKDAKNKMAHKGRIMQTPTTCKAKDMKLAEDALEGKAS